MGIELQNLPVDALRLGQLSTLVERNCVGAHGLKVHGQTLILPPGNKVQGAAHWVSVLTQEREWSSECVNLFEHLPVRDLSHYENQTPEAGDLNPLAYTRPTPRSSAFTGQRPSASAKKISPLRRASAR